MLMILFGYGLSFDVENIPFAVIDRDRTNLSRDYAYRFIKSRYFDFKGYSSDERELDPIFEPKTVTCEGGKRCASHQKLNQRITRAYEDPAIAATAPQKEVAQDGNVIVRANGLAASRTPRAGENHRLTKR